MTLLSVQGLSKNYGVLQAADAVGFELADREALAIIGPNGAGKSTCFNMIGGQIQPDAGTVQFNGRDITGLPARNLFRAGIGRTFQIASVFRSMTVGEAVQTAMMSRDRVSLSIFRPARSYALDQAHALLNDVGLMSLADIPCQQLAYGDLKRVELALALVNRPALLLMDEPTAGMAAGERLAMMALVRETARNRGIGILFTEHDMDVVFGHADRIVVMNRGKVIAMDTPDRIRADKTVQAIYLGEET